MKKILAIIPLLILFGCEDNSDRPSDFPTINEPSGVYIYSVTSTPTSD